MDFTPKRFGTVWASYAEKVMPKEAGEVQRQETRRAFYAGAQGLLSLLLEFRRAVAEGKA